MCAEIAVVKRSRTYSPNNVNSDSLIITLVAQRLKEKGLRVNVYEEDACDVSLLSENVIVNMCRNPKSILALQEKEKNGSLVINSGFGIENSTRENMTKILERASIPGPKSMIVSTDCEGFPELYGEAGFTRSWIKKADGHSIHKEDVAFVRHVEEAQEVLAEYSLRGIKRAVINNHLVGDLVKFYGVADSDFFHTLYPLEDGYSKFGNEVFNGEVHNYNFDRAELQRVCRVAAKSMNLDVYGGDCIIDGDGNFSIIDFNDWPSFSPCRVAGSDAIAELVVNRTHEIFC